MSSALELLRAAGRSTAEIEVHARHALREAADRAFALNAFAHAAQLHEQALALWPEDDSVRPELLFRRAHALHLAADERQLEALELARDTLLEVGDRTARQKRRCLLARAWWYRGTWDRARSAYEQAVSLLDDGISDGLEGTRPGAGLGLSGARRRARAGDSGRTGGARRRRRTRPRGSARGRADDGWRRSHRARR